MLEHLNKVEEDLLNALRGQTLADDRIYFNRLTPLVIDPDANTEQAFVLGDFYEESANDDVGGWDYVIEAKYAFTCLIANTMDQDVAASARLLAHQVQEILKSETTHPYDLYTDLIYEGCTAIIDETHAVKLVGYRLNYRLTYQV